MQKAILMMLLAVVNSSAMADLGKIKKNSQDSSPVSVNNAISILNASARGRPDKIRKYSISNSDKCTLVYIDGNVIQGKPWLMTRWIPISRMNSPTIEDYKESGEAAIRVSCEGNMECVKTETPHGEIWFESDFSQGSDAEGDANRRIMTKSMAIKMNQAMTVLVKACGSGVSKTENIREYLDKHKASRDSVCDGLYSGKAVTFVADSDRNQGIITGVGNGVASAKVISGTYGYNIGKVIERPCNSF